VDFGPTKIRENVMDCEAATFERVQELNSDDVDKEAARLELQDVRTAAMGLVRIKTDKLSEPGLPTV
jgi:hypothetical protein